MPAIDTSRVLVLATHGFEQSELEVPRDALKDRGATVHVVSLDGEAICGWKGSDWGTEVPADAALADVSAADYDAIVLPGGQINPDILRTKPEAISLVKDFHAAGKIIAAICHGPWLLVEAGIVKDLPVTSYHSIRTDVENAGGKWEDSAVVCERGIVTSRSPDDLQAFIDKLVEEIREGRHERRAA